MPPTCPTPLCVCKLAALVFVTGLTLLANLVSPMSAQIPDDSPSIATKGPKPNIVFVLCDDLGYGDVHCLAPTTSKIATPHADQLAREGMIFTDAHSGSSVCSPTRYGLLTGRYAWRTRLQKGVLTGYAPSLIAQDRPTLGSFLQQRGYDTAVIGKWHLDFQYLNPENQQPYRRKDQRLPPIGAKIPDGPVHRGFDFFHGFHHARDMKAVIENDRVMEHDAVENMLPRLTKAATDYIASRNPNSPPFFLYLPLGSPHTPIVPTKQWRGKSGLGDYGDFVMQTDHALGAVCKALKSSGLVDNTIVIFSSDNGCSKEAGIGKLKEQGHLVSGPYRGSKADIWEGGHRVPFIVRWPGKVKPGTICDQTICLTDVFATTADLLDADLPPHSCEDSVSFASLLDPSQGDSNGSEKSQRRAGIVHHSFSGHFGYRMGKWKLILARGSGGWSSPNEKQMGDGAPEAQLYDLSKDIREQNNLYDSRRDIADQLLTQLKNDVAKGSSTGLGSTENDVDKIKLWKNRK